MTGSEPEVTEHGGVVQIANELVALGFDVQRGGALVSISDPATGWQFVRHQEGPKTLFRLALRRKADQGLEWYESGDATQCTWEMRRAESGALTLAITAAGFRRPALHVTVAVTLSAGSALSTWRLRLSGVGEDAVEQAVYPLVSGVLKMGGGVAGETIAVPVQGEGYAFHDPYPMVDNLPLKAGEGPDTPMVGVGQIYNRRYPGGYSVQLLLYYTPTAGLYLACHDAGMQVKEFGVGPIEGWSSEPVLSIAHLPTAENGDELAIDYDTILGVFHGDWYDGADIYKAWARRQWWCAKAMVEKDLAPWLRSGVGVFQMQNYDIPVLNLTHPLDAIAETVNSVAHVAGVPLLALVFNYEREGAWTGPTGMFPAREGDAAFRQAMATLRRSGNYGFVYIPGGNWYIALSSYDPPFDGWPAFESEGRAIAITGPDGQVHLDRTFPGWEAALLCPHTDYVKKLTAELVLGCVERGCSVVQIDNFPITQAQACYNPDHGHSLGYGPWWAESWCAILEQVRQQARALDPNAALTSEGISEVFIPWLDLFDQRAGTMEYFGHYLPGLPMGGELIPLFSYIYGGYIGAYSAAFPECSRPEILYWARCFGKSLTHGVIPTGGWYLPESADLNPVTTAFFEKVARAAAQECWKYIMFGEMLRPPVLEVPVIEFAYVRWQDLVDLPKRRPEVRHVVTDSAVQLGSFRAMDGTVGHILVNVSRQAADFDLELPSYGGTGVFAVERVLDGTSIGLLAGVSLPSSLQLHLEPLSVLLVEVKESRP